MVRIGTGFDAHRFKKGRKLILGGVEVPHEMGLDGHSDADVVVHAVMDALLGAMALGDIGQHFPDTDPAYKGADSIKLLEASMSLLSERGASVVNIDCTILAEEPKMSPYIEDMRTKMANAMNISSANVSVKATTMEKMGFIGRGEGIAVMAAACVDAA